VMPPGKPPTMADVARAVGVSPMTVSRAFREDAAISDATRDAVATWLEGKSYSKIGVALAGGILGPRGPIDSPEASLAAFTDVYAINVTGNLAVLAGLLPRMREHRFGRIIGFAGGGAAYAYPMFPAYAASKAAMVRTIENLAEDLKPAGDFAAVALAPGAVETDMLAEVRKAGAEIRTTVDVAEPARFCTEFLSCDQCGFSGSFVHVRDEWPKLLEKDAKLEPMTKWKLRRTE